MYSDQHNNHHHQMESKSLFKQRTAITQQRAVDSLESLSLILICAQASEIASLNLDSNFKNPVVHNKIKQINEHSRYITDFVRKMPVLSSVDMEYVEDIGGLIYNTIKILVQFKPEEIEAYNKVLGKLVAEAIEREKQEKK